MTTESQVAALLTFRSSPCTALATLAASAVLMTPRRETLRVPTGLRLLRCRTHRAVALAKWHFTIGPLGTRQYAEERHEVAQLRAREHLPIDLGHRRRRSHPFLHLLRIDAGRGVVGVLEHDLGGCLARHGAGLGGAVLELQCH